MSKLIIIRHSETKQQPDTTSHEWRLTERGRERCEKLAEQLKPYDISRIITSEEHKAMLTGQLTADVLNIPCESTPDLGETKRDTAPYFDSVDDFRAAIRNGMENPNELVFGEERFADARTRFSNRIDTLIKQYPNQTIAIFTHGTVMSLYLADVTGRDIYEFWTSLGMPAYVALNLPDKTLEKFVQEVT